MEPVARVSGIPFGRDECEGDELSFLAEWKVSNEL
jgi:hypothetical protein